MGESTCIFACLQCERSQFCWELHHSRTFTLHAQGIKVVKWISAYESLTLCKTNILIPQSKFHKAFVFPFHREFFFDSPIFDYAIWTLNSEKWRKNLITTISLVYMNDACTVLRNVFVICCTHALIHSYTQKHQRKNRDEDLCIRISWFYTLWEFVGFPSRWCWWCNVYHAIITIIRYLRLKCCSANVMQFNPFVENFIMRLYI